MRAEIDLHEMTVIEAQVALNQLIDSLGWEYDEILVVHGYHSGILQNFVRTQYRHKRVKQIILSLNPGDTSLLLRSRQEMAEEKKKHRKK